MTPDKARELLENATPGPWEARATYANGTPRRDTSRQMRAGDQYLGIMHAPDADLAAAAPYLAKLVAGMHYEYAAQVEHDGRKKIVTDSDNGLCLLGGINSEMQDWHRDRTDAQDYADCWNSHYSKRTGATARIVRRLVTDEEVAE